MLGIGKKVERVRKALYEGFINRANDLIQKGGAQQPQHEGIRALVLLDIADVLRKLTIEDKDDGD